MSNLPALDDYRLHYSGNLVGKIEGQLIGPNRMNEWFVIHSTTYDQETNRTTARVRFATLDDVKETWK